jgi:hypothetical protein
VRRGWYSSAGYVGWVLTSYVSPRHLGLFTLYGQYHSANPVARFKLGLGRNTVPKNYIADSTHLC